MSWLGNVLNFEGFNLKNIGKKIGQNPEQLLIGAGDPFSAGVWSKITGKDYQPLVNQMGGATGDTYQKAEAAGINTGPGKSMHGIAQAVASMYAGGYGAGQAGGLMGGSPGTTAAGTSTPGTFSQAMGSLDKYSKAIGTASNVVQMGQGLLSQPQAPAPAAMPQRGAVDMSGLLSQGPDWQDKSLARKQLQQQMMGLLGGGYGR